MQAAGEGLLSSCDGVSVCRLTRREGMETIMSIANEPQSSPCDGVLACSLVHGEGAEPVPTCDDEACCLCCRLVFTRALCLLLLEDEPEVPGLAESQGVTACTEPASVLDLLLIVRSGPPSSSTSSCLPEGSSSSELMILHTFLLKNRQSVCSGDSIFQSGIRFSTG